jgi:hypothetical protein
MGGVEQIFFYPSNFLNASPAAAKAISHGFSLSKIVISFSLPTVFIIFISR